MSAEFWPPFSVDPVIDTMYRAHGYQIDRLPATALEFLDCLRQIGHRIGEREDLDLQNPHSHSRVEVLGGHADQAAAGGSGEGVDGGLDVVRAAGAIGHKGSSRCAEGAGTPCDATVGAATDTGGGVGRGLSAPADPTTTAVAS